MPVSNDFLNYVLDQLSGWGKVSARRMFGGAGLYRDGRIFGLIANDVVYLKVGKANLDDYLKAGSGPFIPYPEKRKGGAMSYYEVPAGILEDRVALAQWAERSFRIGIGPE